MQFYAILGLLFSLIVAIFAVQNSSSVDVKFLTWGFTNVSLVLVIITSVVGGALITFFFSLPNQLRQAMKINNLTMQNKKLTADLAQTIKVNSVTNMDGDEDPIKLTSNQGQQEQCADINNKTVGG